MKAAKERTIISKLWLAVALAGALLCVGPGAAGASTPSPPTSGEKDPGSSRFGLDASQLEPESFAEYVLLELAQKREERAGSYSWRSGEGEQGKPEQASSAPPELPPTPERSFGLLVNGSWPERDHFHLFASLHVERGPPVVLPVIPKMAFEYPRWGVGEKPHIGDFYLPSPEPQVLWNEWFRWESVLGSVQGAWTDPVTGFAYHRARWYDPRNAAFLSEDPLGDIDSPNLYAYVANSPFNGIDPKGTACLGFGGKAARCGDYLPRIGAGKYRRQRHALLAVADDRSLPVAERNAAAMESNQQIPVWFLEEASSFLYNTFVRGWAEEQDAYEDVEQRYAEVLSENGRDSFAAMSQMDGEGYDTRLLFKGGMPAGGPAKGALRSLGKARVASPKTASLVEQVQVSLARYPTVIDPRTGRGVPMPSSIVRKTEKPKRVVWTRQDRGAFIREWHKRGFDTPEGGWAKYDVHHIHPREFGGTNEFWNLVPVERNTHREFNTFWREYGG